MGIVAEIRTVPGTLRSWRTLPKCAKITTARAASQYSVCASREEERLRRWVTRRRRFFLLQIAYCETHFGYEEGTVERSLRTPDKGTQLGRAETHRGRTGFSAAGNCLARPVGGALISEFEGRKEEND